MERLNGIVKQVISADTYILIGAKKGGIAQERQISLACIQCPKLFMKSQNVEKNEEPFAWESREFVRKMIIGKNVSFVVEYSYNNRTYCSVFFEEQNLSILLLERGYANLVLNKNVKTNIYSELENYYKEAKEKKVGIFGNNINYYVRNIIYSYNDKNENKKIYDLFLNKKLKCVVEHIRDGSNFRVYAEYNNNEKKEIKKKENTEKNLEKKKKNNIKKKREEEENDEATKNDEKYLTMYYFSFSLCGVIVDMFKKEIANNVETVKEELYAMETKKFVESRLLNRDIEVEIKHIDNNCNLYANVNYKLGNICVLLLRSGYAYINEYTVKYVDNPIEYKKALDEAIQLRKKKWINYTEKEVDYEKEYICTVIEVLYGDVIIVDYKNEERRLYMASIKCEKHSTDLKLNTLCILAKDYLKSQIVGEKVKIVTEYVKTPQSNSDGYIPQCSDDKGRMHFVSVYKMEKKKNEEKSSKVNSPNKWDEKKGKKKSSNKSKAKNINNQLEENKITFEEQPLLNGDVEYINLNEQLVAKGLARVINHRQDDEKASNYFHLQELEKDAEEKKLGRFNPHIEIIKINNISGSENALRARSFENVLNKYNNLNAYVDFIYGANKFKLYIPSQNLLINFILLGITVQKINLKDLNNIEMKFKKSNEEYLNGEIRSSKKEKNEYKEIAVQAYKYTRKKLMQRNVQITIVTCDKGGNFIGILKHQNKDFSIHLLSLGYGMLNEIGLNNTSERNNYIKAAEEAKNQKKNIWSIEKADYIDDVLKSENDLTSYDNIYYCSYLDDINNICIQLKNKQEELKKLQEELNKSSNLELSAITEINKNSLVLAKYIDNYYYRAIVLQINKNKKKVLVKYIDFGNEEELDFNDIKKLNEKFNLKNHPPYSIKAALAGLKIPNENKSDLISYIKKFLLDKFLYIKFEKKESNIFHVVFYDYEQFNTNKNVKSVNEEIVFNGICYVDNSSNTKIFEKLKKEEALAKKNKLFIWSYGDIDYDDEK
ncbi:tudor staphylococcal nuclease, putative [Plasmodium gallinaceum]|uniref:Tudor staphylococcal nuclease, putative n=1 Tax=Plasmodium gallinaceum TaxID=5849 RepID=A0A1J1GV62_PLAGA|nr:tudor staphylococcal nuclease, putative [Plasmodium gallinaceum]CRG96415.1 tudor staphylococcal nuclease, putative [Plasmodium gallinaceum]